MCVMWFRASDMGKTTFSKCFLVPSVMFGGGDSVSVLRWVKFSPEIRFLHGVWDWPCEGSGWVWSTVLCQNQEGVSHEWRENKEVGTEMFTYLCWEPVLRRGRNAEPRRCPCPALPGALRASRAGFVAPSRVETQRAGSGSAFRAI